MSNCLVLNSSNVLGRNNNIYKYNFVNGMFSIKEDAEIAISSITIPYSWFNITSAYNNNSFRFTWYGTVSTTFTVNIPDGFYLVSDINNFLENFMIQNKLYLIDSSTGQYVFYIQLYTASTYYSNQILCFAIPTSLPSGFTTPVGWPGFPAIASTPLFTVLNNNFQQYLGFTTGSYPSITQTTNYSVLSNLLPPEGSVVNSVIVRCSIIENNVTMPTDILDSFGIDATFGSNIIYNPPYQKWVKIKRGTYADLAITFVDQNFNNIAILDSNVTITLLLKQNK
jgi:hypothetical protein